MSKFTLLADDIDIENNKAKTTMEMLCQFLKNKTEINELSIRGADFIMEDTQKELELIKSKFHMLIKEVKSGNNKSTN